MLNCSSRRGGMVLVTRRTSLSLAISLSFGSAALSTVQEAVQQVAARDNGAQRAVFQFFMDLVNTAPLDSYAPAGVTAGPFHGIVHIAFEVSP